MEILKDTEKMGLVELFDCQIIDQSLYFGIGFFDKRLKDKIDLADKDGNIYQVEIPTDIIDRERWSPDLTKFNSSLRLIDYGS